MKSIAYNQFPIFVWREGNRNLWNPIHKKALKNRPEERVRLRIIDALLQRGWSKHRITTEEAIRDYSESNLRTDIICYNQHFDPQILVECKAENVTLSTATGEQVARYNDKVEAPYLLISNGKSDFWYRIDTTNSEVKELQEPPQMLKDPQSRKLDFDYWKQRGFAGPKAIPPLRKWLEPILDQFSTHGDIPLKYLQFEKSPSDLNLSHYYQIFSFKEQKIALSFLNTPFGGTRLIGILNREGENKAVAELNLDLIFEKEHPNTSLYSAAGTRNVGIEEFLVEKQYFSHKARTTLEDLSSALARFFENTLN